jgi:hypothetical protein
MKTILTLLVAAFLAANVNAQSLIPVTPEEAQVARLAQAAAATQYYTELAAQAFARLHGEIFIGDDETLRLTLNRLGPQQSEQLFGLYEASASGINQILAASGSGVRAPVERTRIWTWDGTNVVVEPVPAPAFEPEPTPAP